METLEKRLQKRIHVSLYALLFLTMLLGLSVLLEGCSDNCEITNEYTYYEPVYKTLNEIRAGVNVGTARTVTSLGKIYYKSGLFFLNQPGEGIHVIDNHDPYHPVFKSFITVPGNYDLAIKGNALYADSFVDLVVLDISDINSIHEIKRVENVFSNYNSLGFYVDPVKGIVTDWAQKKDVKVSKSDCTTNDQSWGGIYYEDGIALRSGVFFDKSSAITPGTGSGPGVGGSMARFTINADHLYALDGGDVETINITSETNPVFKTRTSISWDMETIFPYKNNLFIGSRSGMHILDISTPESPVKVSTYEHIRVCDPVVVEDTLAFVTLHSGTECQGFTNQLEVINIKNLSFPQIVKTYPMTNPQGLGIDNNTLFICDGDAGLKIFDAENINQIDQHQLAHYYDINAFDVIPFNNLLMMVGSDGIFQYDYSNPKDIKFLSKIAVVHEN
jgi:hypothetical protein